MSTDTLPTGNFLQMENENKNETKLRGAAVLAKNRAAGIVGGRPRGVRNKIQLEKDIIKKQFDQRILSVTDSLFHSQVVTALGTWKMITMQKDSAGKIQVTTINDTAIMQEYFETKVCNQDYFLVEGTLPDWRAIESLHNRVFGKPKESIDVAVGHFSLLELAKMRAAQNTLPVANDVLHIAADEQQTNNDTSAPVSDEILPIPDINSESSEAL